MEYQQQNTTVHQLLPVLFRSDTLYLLEHEGDPYVPMKPIVEGMGLSWQPQHRKLTEEGSRWNSCVTMMVTTGSDGKRYEMLCMPLRKLPAWLMSISPNKVSPEIKDVVTDYQNTCDDILWEQWKAKSPFLRDMDGGLPPASFQGHEPGSLVPVVREFRAALRGAVLVGYSGACARAKANAVVRDRQKVDLGKVYGIDFDEVCPPGNRETHISRMSVDAVNTVLDAFWQAYYQLETESRNCVNHSKKPDTIAINLPQFIEACTARGLDIPTHLELKQNLRLSESPQYIDLKAVDSIITNITIKCWVFRNP